MKYLKTYESINPDRISDGTFRIYSDKLGFIEGGSIDKDDQNLFYVSKISWGSDDNTYETKDLDTWFDYHEDFEYPSGAQVCIDFYSPRLTLFGEKVLRVTFVINECGGLETFYGEIGGYTRPSWLKSSVVDILFSEKSFKDLLEFIEDDSPQYYYVLDNIKYSDLRPMRKNLLRRI